MLDFYQVLEIGQNATDEEIIKAFKEKAKEFHPDKNGESKASDEMFKLISLAKETLLDPIKREEHDIAVGIKQAPVTERVVYRNEVGQLVGLGLLGLIAGFALAKFKS